MSTKLYDGLKFKNKEEDLFTTVPIIEQAIKEEFYKEIPFVIAEEISNIIDNTTRENFDPDESIFFLAEKEWNNRQNKFGRHSTFHDPLRFSIVFGKSNKNNILVYPFYKHSGYMESLLKTELFEDYHYQNNSDHPTEISEKDWDDRRAEWDSIMSPEGSFSQLPMWSLGNSQNIFSTALLEEYDYNKYFPQEKRLKRVLINTVTQRIALDGFDKSKIYGMIHDVNKIVSNFMKTDESKLIELPTALPHGIFTNISELPPIYVPDEELVEKLIKLYEE